jgi:phosphoenolpyruvate synthase/pyruvate phosphate dikinase
MEDSVPIFIVPFSQVPKNSIGMVGGKGANLAELSQAGLPVPDGFCLSTEAFACFMASCPDVEKFYLSLERLDARQPKAVHELGDHSPVSTILS